MELRAEVGYGLLATLITFVLAWPLLKSVIKFLIIYWCVPWRNSKGERMKGEPPKLPYGQINQVNFFGRPLSKKYGPVYYIWHCLTPIVLLADAEAIRSFYTDHYSHKRDRDFTSLGCVWKQVLGDCLANSHGRDEVKRCRGPFEKYFTSSMVMSVLPIIGRECRSFIAKVPKNSPVDLMKEGLSKVTLRVLIQIVYGEEVLQKHFTRILQISDQLQDTVDLFNVGETKLPFYSKLPTSVNRQAQSFNKTWADFNRFLFEEYEEGRLNSSGDGLFFVMMEQLRSNSLELKEQELFHSVDEILLLNIDVSFAATSFALADIARHSDVQSKLRNEIDEALEGQDPSIFQDLDKRLPYMEMVLKESARMHPALALSLPERTVKPLTDMAGYFIPQGTPVCVDTHSLNYSEKYWKNPDEFKPERFAEGTRQVPGSYFRFGMGPRKCLGYRYALAITRIVVASVLQKYKISLADPLGSPKIKTRGMPFFTPYICTDVVFTERSS
ncbi:cytochrome P450 3A6-like [Actinia tenebrosa]|uniref:Cytochrome P450 3A6-like n=1 Tax=Actinia tenebrosa TaxID=6105 RepID=A0A6P8J170_ACTTE|nr:cytochrome P450 3A6-like [Actinia tenebrosa]